MNFEALGPAHHIQSAVDARLDHGVGTRAGDLEESGGTESAEGQAPFTVAGESVETDVRVEQPGGDVKDASEKTGAPGAPGAPGVPGTQEEVRRLLEDREEELSLELRLQKSGLADDPGRTIQQLSELRRDAFPGDPGRVDYQVASEVARELVSARLKHGSTESEAGRSEGEDDKSLSGRTPSGTDLPSSLGSGHEPRVMAPEQPSISA